MKTVLYFQSGLCESNNTKLEGVYRYAKAARWRIHVVPYASAVLNREQAGRSVVRPDVKALIEFWHPIGAIIDSGSSSAVLDRGVFRSLPSVFLDREPVDGALCISSNASEIADVAVKELMSVKCAAYGYVPFEVDVPWSRERGNHFAEFVRLNGRKCHVFRKRLYHDDSETYRLWLCEWLKVAPRPFGVFAANDYMAQVVLACAARARIRIPDELRVIGVDNDLQICEHSEPSLTSVILDFEKAGYLAAECLMDRLSHPRKRCAGRTFGVFGVQRRKSTSVYSRHDDRIIAAVERIRQHACDGLRARDVFAGMGCSRRMAEIRFREVTGHSVLDEIQSVRLERAKYLLAHTNEPISSVAASCGYSTTEQLRRLFRAADGMTALKWRKSRTSI